MSCRPRRVLGALFLVLGILASPVLAAQDPPGPRARVAEALDVTFAVALGETPTIAAARRNAWLRWALAQPWSEFELRLWMDGLGAQMDAGWQPTRTLTPLQLRILSGRCNMPQEIREQIVAALFDPMAAPDPGDWCRRRRHRTYQVFDDETAVLEPLSPNTSTYQPFDGVQLAQRVPASPAAASPYQPFDDLPFAEPMPAVVVAPMGDPVPPCPEDWLQLDWSPSTCALHRRFPVIDDEWQGASESDWRLAPLFHPTGLELRDLRLERVSEQSPASWTLVADAPTTADERGRREGVDTIVIRVADAPTAYRTNAHERAFVLTGSDRVQTRAVTEEVLFAHCTGDEVCRAWISSPDEGVFVAFVHILPAGLEQHLFVSAWAYAVANLP